MHEDWRVSLHGGHSGSFCDHATGSLRDVLEAAVAAGFHTYGVSEHAPRLGDTYLYSAERQMGWSVKTLQSLFDKYAVESQELATEFAGRLLVLRGFEAEVVPPRGYREIMLGLRQRHEFDYLVGSVHYVGGIQIDGSPTTFVDAIEAHGGIAELACAYYDTVADMVRQLRPDVVGHLDVIRKGARALGLDDSLSKPPEVHRAAGAALRAIRETGAILDLNTAGYRKGLGHPYPAPDLVRRAGALGIPFCFGDDSHGPDQVGEGIDDARSYLLDCGIESITALDKEAGTMVRREISLR